MTTIAKTAEWVCTRCGSTNRKLVPSHLSQVTDRCVSCKTVHTISPGTRPVRWDARLAS